MIGWRRRQDRAVRSIGGGFGVDVLFDEVVGGDAVVVTGDLVSRRGCQLQFHNVQVVFGVSLRYA